MLHFTDMMGHQLSLGKYPVRIVSVVPSQTELLFDLGLDEEVIGITKFCVHPEAWFRTKKRVGGTKTLNIDTISALQPDLIIANKEENTQADIELLQQRFPVWLSDIRTVDDAFRMITAIGALVNKEREADELLSLLRSDFSTLPPVFKDKKVAYFIWKDPWMVAADQTFVDSVLRHLGAENVFGSLTRYPEVTPALILDSKADLLLLSSEPFPFREKHTEELRQLLPDARVMLVDGEVFSWYGSRLRHLKSYLLELEKHMSR